MKINEKNLSVFASTPPYDMTGILNKRGEVNKAFQKRYFVLKGNLLFYFEKKGDKEPLGLIIVEGCTIELSEESDQFCFEIAFNGNRTYVLSADSQESMEAWMKTLTCAGYEYKKLMFAELQRQLEEIEGSRNRIPTEPATTTLLKAPKPPPRRTNPFNRPAPPIPSTNSDKNEKNELPFINGHFGSTSQRTNWINTEQIPEVDTINQQPALPRRGGRSTFYQQLESSQQPQQKSQNQQQSAKTTTPTSSTTTTTTTTTKSVFHTPISASTKLHFENYHGMTFEQLHEKFRKTVMKDVIEYQMQRELKEQPLIAL